MPCNILRPFHNPSDSIALQNKCAIEPSWLVTLQCSYSTRARVSHRETNSIKDHATIQPIGMTPWWQCWAGAWWIFWWSTVSLEGGVQFWSPGRVTSTWLVPGVRCWMGATNIRMGQMGGPCTADVTEGSMSAKFRNPLHCEGISNLKKTQNADYEAGQMGEILLWLDWTGLDWFGRGQREFW